MIRICTLTPCGYFAIPVRLRLDALRQRARLAPYSRNSTRLMPIAPYSLRPGARSAPEGARTGAEPAAEGWTRTQNPLCFVFTAPFAFLRTGDPLLYPKAQLLYEF